MNALNVAAPRHRSSPDSAQTRHARPRAVRGPLVDLGLLLMILLIGLPALVACILLSGG